MQSNEYITTAYFKQTCTILGKMLLLSSGSEITSGSELTPCIYIDKNTSGLQIFWKLYEMILLKSSMHTPNPK